MKPTIGRIVLYVLSAQDSEEINRLRTNPENIRNRINDNAWPLGAQAHIGNHVQQGDIFPAQVVRVWTDDCINIKVNLDGTDTYWATSRHEDDEKNPGTWHWMDYQKKVAAAETVPQAPLTGVSGGTPGADAVNETEPAKDTAPAESKDPDGNNPPEQTPEELEKLKAEVGF